MIENGEVCASGDGCTSTERYHEGPCVSTGHVEDRPRELFVLCPQCAGSGAVTSGEDEDNCDLCAAKGYALLTAVITWENDL